MSNLSLTLPETLRERLIAAGVTDEVSMQAALERDAELRREFEAFLTDNGSEIQRIAQQALEQFAAVRDSNELIELAERIPFVLEESFDEAVQQTITEADQYGDTELAEGLRARLKGLRQIRAQVQVALPQMLQAFASVANAGEMLELAQRAPAILDDTFMTAVQQTITELEQSGQSVAAEGLRARLEGLYQVRQQRELERGSPLVQALLTFLNAHSDDEARQIYAEQVELLAAADALATLDQTFHGADTDSQERISARRALLVQLQHQ
jgi:hypothetical protein